MKILFAIMGTVFFVGGIALGIYGGFWLMFVGGFIEIINAIKAPVTIVSEVGEVGYGLLKIILSSISFTLTFWFCTIISGIFISAAVD